MKGFFIRYFQVSNLRRDYL